MFSLKSLVVLALALAIVCQGEKFSYKNYRLVRLTPKTQAHIHLLDLWEDNPDFDVWNRIKMVDEIVDVSLSPEAFEHYEPLFKLVNMPYTIVQTDLQSIFDDEQRMMKQDSVNAKNILGRYVRYSEILNFIDELVDSNPDIASSYLAGRTYENRELRVLVLKTPSSSRLAWIESGIHAREWVSVSTNIWIIDRLIKDFRNNDPVAIKLLNTYEFHFLPIVNPDGYEFSHTTTRLWRKNRRPNTGSTCVGTDLNRNADFQWMVAGSSNNPCSDTYAGPSGSSEVETRAIQSTINARPNQWDIFIDIHCYSQYWMPPYGYTPTLPTTYTELKRVADIGAAALTSLYGTPYLVGSPANILYSASGGLFDWAYAVAKVKYSYALELRPGPTGPDSQFGFALPEDRAPNVGEETYIGIKAMINAI